MTHPLKNVSQIGFIFASSPLGGLWTKRCGNWQRLGAHSRPKRNIKLIHTLSCIKHVPQRCLLKTRAGQLVSPAMVVLSWGYTQGANWKLDHEWRCSSNIGTWEFHHCCMLVYRRRNIWGKWFLRKKFTWFVKNHSPTWISGSWIDAFLLSWS